VFSRRQLKTWLIIFLSLVFIREEKVATTVPQIPSSMSQRPQQIVGIHNILMRIICCIWANCYNSKEEL